MGLDIAFISRTGEQENDSSCHGLSRTFCRLVCDLHDLEGRSPELRQLFALLQLDIEPLLKMNVWDVDQHILNSSWLVSYEEIELRYEKAWQKSSEILQLLTALYQKTEADLSIFNQLQMDDWLEDRGYFQDFDTNTGQYGVDQNFGGDLRTMIQWLETLEAAPGSEVRFHFF